MLSCLILLTAAAVALQVK